MHHAGQSSVNISIIDSYYLPQGVSDPKTLKDLYSAKKAVRCLGRKEKGQQSFGPQVPFHSFFFLGFFF